MQVKYLQVIAGQVRDSRLILETSWRNLQEMTDTAAADAPAHVYSKRVRPDRGFKLQNGVFGSKILLRAFTMSSRVR